MKDPLWRRLRRRWHVALRGMTPAAADDLIDGMDLGDHPVRMPPIRPRFVRLAQKWGRKRAR